MRLFNSVCLPEAWNNLTGQGVCTQRGYEADKSDTGVPEFDGLGARLFHDDTGIEGMS